MPKISKTSCKLAGIAVFTGIFVYCTSKLVKKPTNENYRYALAITYYQDGDYKAALENFRLLSNMTPDILIYVLDCHINVGNILDAIIVLDQLIKQNPIRNSINFLEKRFKCNDLVNLQRDAFRDLFLISCITDSRHSEALEYLKNYSKKCAEKFQITGKVSKIILTNGFSELFFLGELSDPVISAINSEDFGKCYHLAAEASNPFYQFILGYLIYLKGGISEALRVLLSSSECRFHSSSTEVPNDFIYSKLFIIYMNSTIRNTSIEEFEQIDLLLKVPVGNNLEYISQYIECKAPGKTIEYALDPTLLFLISKVYENNNDYEAQLHTVERALKLISNEVLLNTKIIILIRLQRIKDAKILVDMCLKEFPTNISLLCISIEFYLSICEFNKIPPLYQKLINYYKSDPRTHILGYLIAKEMDKDANVFFEEDGNGIFTSVQNDSINVNISKFLDLAIEADPFYYNTYMHYAAYFLGQKPAIAMYERALEHASTSKEVFNTMQVLIVTEVQLELMEDYPELFGPRNG